MNPTLTPAYGRTYKTQLEAITDFHNGKDFLINNVWGSHLCNRGDLIDRGHKEVNIRYIPNAIIVVRI